MEKKVTRRDIAVQCGVSVSVVSRALNNSGYVDESKRKQIIETARKLGYVPQPVAMSLAEKRVRQILYCCSNLNNDYNLEVYRGMCAAANRRGYMAVIDGLIRFDRIRDMMVDGLIMQDEYIAEYYVSHYGRNYSLPVVSCYYGGAVSSGKCLPQVEVDMDRVVEIAMKYLFRMGHRKIAYAHPYYDVEYGSGRPRAYADIMRRRVGDDWKSYFLSIDSKAMPYDRRLEAFDSHSSDDEAAHEEYFFERGKIAAQVFRERALPCTAVLCFNDEVAAGMITEFRRMGVRVPEDVSVMGIDGTRVRSYTSPMLTSVDIRPHKHGEAAADMLIDLIEHRNTKRVIRISPKLLEGESVRDAEGQNAMFNAVDYFPAYIPAYDDTAIYADYVDEYFSGQTPRALWVELAKDLRPVNNTMMDTTAEGQIFTSVNQGLEEGLDAEGIRSLLAENIETACAEVKEQQIQVLKDAGVWEE